LQNVKRQPSIIQYDREKAVWYAHKWALGRNQKYFDFDNFGGDCTNFASQVIYAGSGIMNYTPVYGWYYNDSYDRTPSWTGVDFLYDFLINNEGLGPFAEIVNVSKALPGDIVQLSFGGENHFNHSPVIVSTGGTPSYNNILISTHSDDVNNYPLTGYEWNHIRFIHVLGVRR